MEYSARGVEDPAALDQVVRTLGGEQLSPPLEPRSADIPSPHRQEKRGWLFWFSLPRMRIALSVSIGFAAVLFMFRFLLQEKGQLNLPSTAPLTSTPSEGEMQSTPPSAQVAEKPSASKPPPSITEAPPSKVEEKPYDSKAMVSIPAGEFWMGCNEQVDKGCYGYEKPGKAVYLDAYSIDRHEVTVADYRGCVKAGTCSDQNLTMSDFCNWDKQDKDNHPINCVDWNQARTYCRWVGKLLPLEAEWEKAARGTDRRVYPWGNEWDAEKANVNSQGTVPVGSYPMGVSPYGAHDMVGNVWEWVQDWYDSAYYQKSPTDDPQGPEKGESRVVGGGAFWGAQGDVRCAARGRNLPSTRNDPRGCRVVGLPKL